MQPKNTAVPLPQAAAHRRVTREQLLRQVQRGEVAGFFRRGRWYVAESEADAGERAAE